MNPRSLKAIPFKLRGEGVPQDAAQHGNPARLHNIALATQSPHPNRHTTEVQVSLASARSPAFQCVFVLDTALSVGRATGQG